MESHEPGARGAARTSVRSAIFRVGCCWALFAVVVVVGSTNRLRMAALTALRSLERVVGWGDRLARGIGVAAGLGSDALLLLALV